jgi:hypothetical protein
MLKYQYAVLRLVELLVKGRIAQFNTLSFVCSFHGFGAVALFGSELVLNVCSHIGQYEHRKTRTHVPSV